MLKSVSSQLPVFVVIPTTAEFLSYSESDSTTATQVLNISIKNIHRFQTKLQDLYNNDQSVTIMKFQQ